MGDVWHGCSRRRHRLENFPFQQRRHSLSSPIPIRDRRPDPIGIGRCRLLFLYALPFVKRTQSACHCALLLYRIVNVRRSSCRWAPLDPRRVHCLLGGFLDLCDRSLHLPKLDHAAATASAQTSSSRSRDRWSRPNLGFLETSAFGLETLVFVGWKSLDFLGFSRPNRDLSIGYERFSRAGNFTRLPSR